MQTLTRVASLLSALALTACATAPQMSPLSLSRAPTETVALAAPAQVATPAASLGNLGAFIDTAALSKLSAKSKSEASAAQFNALQFGRVGAPRSWTGDNGASGQVTVGPFLRVNLIDCRDFTHTVTISGTSFVHKGTACREADGTWTVSA
jgi:surface antigen